MGLAALIGSDLYSTQFFLKKQNMKFEAEAESHRCRKYTLICVLSLLTSFSQNDAVFGMVRMRFQFARLNSLMLDRYGETSWLSVCPADSESGSLSSGISEAFSRLLSGYSYSLSNSMADESFACNDLIYI